MHDRQHYELVDWRRADFDLNYRRFFAVNTLAAIRVEVPWVFDESHVEVLRWLREGLADGLRVDHPDGLLDPGGYLERLAEQSGGAYVLAEKILEGDERMPPGWATEGTTGYDALADLDRVLVDPAGEAPLTDLDTRLRGGSPADWPTMIHGTKRAIADGILRSEVLRLDRTLVDAASGDDEPGAIADAVAELLAWFPVYRSYLPFGAEHLREAAELTVRHRPELAGVVERLLPILSDPGHPAAQRFQQTSGMVMAKGVEDTAFYRYTRLTSLTEVGGDPAEFAIDVAEFHARSLGAAGADAAVDDDAVDARHEARRGRARPPRRDRGAAGGVGRDPRRAALAGAPRRRPARAPALAGDRRRLAGEPRAPARLRREGRTRGRGLDVVDRARRRVRGAHARARRRGVRGRARRGARRPGGRRCSRRPDGRTRSRPS